MAEILTILNIPMAAEKKNRTLRRPSPGNPTEGFTLMEVMISFLLLALITGSVLVIYTGILAGTNKAEVHLEPLNALEVLSQVFRERAKNTWPVSVDVYSGTFSGLIYDVRDYGKIQNPLDTEKTMEMKRIGIWVYYTVLNAEGKEETRSYATSQLVGN
ncbi:MAG: type II secretion system protein [Candidatus Eremiobacteraeota bacterium]|nr:type II secretion system protein [Candidatus Eremiobacteraeota bacterium]